MNRRSFLQTIFTYSAASLLPARAFEREVDKLITIKMSLIDYNLPHSGIYSKTMGRTVADKTYSSRILTIDELKEKAYEDIIPMAVEYCHKHKISFLGIVEVHKYRDLIIWNAFSLDMYKYYQQEDINLKVVYPKGITWRI